MVYAFILNKKITKKSSQKKPLSLNAIDLAPNIISENSCR